MAKPKVALVNVFFPPQTIGGATRVVADNVDVLEADYSEEYDFVYYTSNEGDVPAHSMDVYARNGRRVYRAGIVRRENMDWEPFDTESGKLFGRFLDHERPDLVHFHCIQRLTASIVEETRRRGIPYVVTVHDAWWISDWQFLVDDRGTVYPDGHPDPAAKVRLPNGVTAARSSERRKKLQKLLGGAARVFTVSESFAAIYRKNGVSNIEVSKNGVSDIKWLPRTLSRSGRVRLAHIGGMAAHKGFFLVKHAIESGGYTNLEVTAVDHSKPFGYRKGEIWGATPVQVIGRVPQDKIAALYAEIDILLAPSTWPESFGLVTREAAAAGCWVIASDIGGIGEDVRPGVDGIIVRAGASRSLQGALQAVDDNPGRYQSSPPGRLFQTAKGQVAQIVSAWSEILENHRRRSDLKNWT